MESIHKLIAVIVASAAFAFAAAAHAVESNANHGSHLVKRTEVYSYSK